jgi:hypothetical protein
VGFVWVYGELLGIKEFRSTVINCDALRDVLGSLSLEVVGVGAGVSRRVRCGGFCRFFLNAILLMSSSKWDASQTSTSELP